VDYQKLYDKRLALCGEMDSVIDLSALTQSAVGNDQLFMRHLSQLFNRIDIMEALKDEAMLCSLEMAEKAARQTGGNECEDT